MNTLLSDAPSSEFEIEEVADLSVATLSVANPFTPEERRSVDAAGLAMESGRGGIPVSENRGFDMVVRIPGDMITRLMGASGVSGGLTLDVAALLGAIDGLLQRSGL